MEEKDLELEEQDITQEEENSPDGDITPEAEDAQKDQDSQSTEQGEIEDTDDSKNQSVNEISHLRQTIRDLQRQVALINARSRSTSQPKKKSDVDDILDDITEDTKPAEVSELEALDTKLQDVMNNYGHAYEIQFENMSLTKEYADIREVCTTENFGDIIETAAQELVKQEGGDVNVIQRRLELSVWSKSSPFTEMYRLIKKYHPKYVETQEQKDKSSTPNPKTPVKVPGSIANSGSTGIVGGWSKKKIDALSELELDQVPNDIYEKYMQGELK
jgi:hypothetical protein